MILSLKYRERLGAIGQFLVGEFDNLVAEIRAAWDVEHTDTGGHGTIHASGTISERGRLVPLGEWINEPVTAASFFGSGTMTYTPVTVTTYAYTLYGKTMTVAFRVTGTLAGVASNQIRIQVPGGKSTASPAHIVDGTTYINQNGVESIGRSAISPLNFIFLSLVPAANWTLGPNVDIRGSLTFEITA